MFLWSRVLIFGCMWLTRSHPCPDSGGGGCTKRYVRTTGSLEDRSGVDRVWATGLERSTDFFDSILHKVVFKVSPLNSDNGCTRVLVLLLVRNETRSNIMEAGPSPNRR